MFKTKFIYARDNENILICLEHVIGVTEGWLIIVPGLSLASVISTEFINHFAKENILEPQYDWCRL